MGISRHAYRCQIGFFNCNMKTLQCTGTKSTKSKTTENKAGLVFLLVALFLSCTVIATQVNRDTQTNQYSSSSSTHQCHSLPPHPNVLQQSSTSVQWPVFPVASRCRGFQCIGAWGVDPPTASNPLFLCIKPFTKI